jgi:hypothetical protein
MLLMRARLRAAGMHAPDAGSLAVRDGGSLRQSGAALSKGGVVLCDGAL